MLRGCLRWSCAVIVAVCFLGGSAFAQDGRIFFQFGVGKLFVYGKYVRPSGSNEDGQAAESRARYEGALLLKNFLESQCDSQDAAALKAAVVPTSKSLPEMTSLGSELFPGGTILVKLAARFSEVFPKYPGRDLVTNGFVFSMPMLPAEAVSCGLVSLRVSSDRLVRVLPVSIGNPSAGTTVVRLRLSGNELKPLDKRNEELLSKVDLAAFESGGIVGLPVMR